MQQFDLTSIRRRLAPLGVLRAAINLGNTLLVSGRDEGGVPTGLAPSVARSLAARLEMPIALTPFASPGEIADRADSDVWDVALIGSEDARNGSIAFTPPYALIEATYLVLAESRLSAISDVDAPGIRVGAPARTAYGLWLERNLVRATLVLADGIAAAGNLLARREIDALAGSGLGSSPTAPTFPVASCCPAGSPRSRKRSATARSIGKSRIFSALSSKRRKPPASSLA
jgi:polar amino acid transport system substrate-binding protein